MIVPLKETKEYLLMMFGAPVIAVDITDEEFEIVINSAFEVVSDMDNKSQKNPSVDQIQSLIKEGSYILLKMLLKTKRRAEQNNIDETIDELYAELDTWRKSVKNTFFFNKKTFMRVLCSLLSNPSIDPLNCKDIALKVMGQIEK
jgi:hypothetical protein